MITNTIKIYALINKDTPTPPHSVTSNEALVNADAIIKTAHMDNLHYVN